MSRTLLLSTAVLLLSGCVMAEGPAGNGGGAVAEPDRMDAVVNRTFTAYGFRLESGQVLPELKLAFETYGQLAPGGENAILVTHGFTSSHHAAGRYTPNDPQPGGWDGLIGPGKAIDTTRYFVVSSNMLGSSYGSTAPATIDPRTGKPYGPGFPDITLRDIVSAQKLMLDGLGVRRLVAVAGPSFGGFQAFQWAVTYPEHMRGIVAVVTAPKGSGGPEAVKALTDRFAKDPNWNGGWHYSHGGIPATMTELRVETLRRYGQNEILAARGLGEAEREARIRAMAERWAREFDPNSMVALRKASVRFDAERDFDRVRAKVLYVLSRTDKLFPPSIAPAVMDRMKQAGIDARYVEIDSDFGHSASGPEWAKWGPALRDFLASLER
jgi:homoserine O-acetyltransferase